MYTRRHEKLQSPVKELVSAITLQQNVTGLFPVVTNSFCIFFSFSRYIASLMAWQTVQVYPNLTIGLLGLAPAPHNLEKQCRW